MSSLFCGLLVRFIIYSYRVVFGVILMSSLFCGLLVRFIIYSYTVEFGVMTNCVSGAEIGKHACLFSCL